MYFQETMVYVFKYSVISLMVCFCLFCVFVKGLVVRTRFVDVMAPMSHRM